MIEIQIVNFLKRLIDNYDVFLEIHQKCNFLKGCGWRAGQNDYSRKWRLQRLNKF